jgi:hypothetical protein
MTKPDNKKDPRWDKLAELVPDHDNADIAMAALDELVHEFKSNEASNINNAGWLEQLEYVRSNGSNLEDILQLLDLEDLEKELGPCPTKEDS